MFGSDWEKEFQRMDKDKLDKFVNNTAYIPFFVFREFTGLETVLNIAKLVAKDRGIEVD